MIKYRAFIQVVESGSITKAAKALGYSQPGISYMIDSLEKEMGFPLLIRSKDKVQPTKDGARVLYHCKQIVNSEDDLKETVRAINGLMDGTIFIASQNSMLVNVVPRILSRFAQSFSGITVNLSELPFSAFYEGFQSGDIDLGFMSETKIKGFEFHPLFRDPLCIIMHESHPFTRYEKVPASVLNGCDFIMSNLQTSLLPPNVVSREFEEGYSRTMGYTVKSLKNATPALAEFIRTTEKTVREFVAGEKDLTPA